MSAHIGITIKLINNRCWLNHVRPMCIFRTLSISRCVSSAPTVISNGLVETSCSEATKTVNKDLSIHENFITEAQENYLVKEIEKHFKGSRYEYDHWDDAIHGYRETEKSRWTEDSKMILQKVREVAFPSDASQIPLVHVLDLAKDGYIKPHVDSVKFCGTTIAGLCLLSTSVMKLVNENNPEEWINILLRPRTLYVMRDLIRYNFTHEIMKDSESIFKGENIPRERRISVMFRNEPPPKTNSPDT